MKRIKLTALWLTAVLAAASFSGCSEKENTSQEGSEVSEAVTEAVTERELTQEQKDAAKEKGISEERYCVDNTYILSKSEEMLKIYYEGITEADHDKCFDVFPDFYKKAVEKENMEYGETNEEYMQSLRDNFVEKFGDDFYIFPSLSSVLQLSDESLKEIEVSINNAFKLDIKLKDGYMVYFSETTRGKLDKQTQALRFMVLNIDENYYLYDDYYEYVENN